MMSERRKSRLSSPRENPYELSQQPTDELEIDLLELCYRLLDKWKMIVCFILLFALSFGLYTKFLVTPLYEATSTIYVLSRKDSAINMSDLQIGSALTADYIKVFDIWEVHEAVLSNLNLPYTYSEMAKMLRVTNASNTRMLDITVTSPYASEAAAMANEYAVVVSKYIEETMSTDRPNIMSVALVPSNPISPNITNHVFLGAGLGGMLAIAIVILQTLANNKYKTMEDIRKYSGLSVLAVVPTEDAMRDKKGGNSL